MWIYAVKVNNESSRSVLIVLYSCIRVFVDFYSVDIICPRWSHISHKNGCPKLWDLKLDLPIHFRFESRGLDGIAERFQLCFVLRLVSVLQEQFGNVAVRECFCGFCCSYGKRLVHIGFASRRVKTEDVRAGLTIYSGFMQFVL